MILENLYSEHFGSLPERITSLTPAGSNRRYYRLEGMRSAIGVIGTSIDENKAFIYLDRHFRAQGLPVPEIYAVSSNYLAYIQEDLGDTSLFTCRDDLELLKKTIRILPDFQFLGSQDLDFAKCYPVPKFDRQSVMWDLNYFKYSFLNTENISYREDLLEKDFQMMTERLSCHGENTFMYRDFQSRNVMIKNYKPYFIDFQGGRKGPIEYDVVSFLWQAKAGFSDYVKNELISDYIDSASRYININDEDFKSRLKDFALLRTLQVLGAYGFRGRFERKSHFLQSIPLAITNLDELMKAPIAAYPCLNSILSRLVEVEMEKMKSTNSDSLTVTVTSFSFKKGIPEDCSGNGGGYVFDCRGMDNPGRYEEYKKLTGLDRPVIDFLESRGEIKRFLDNCYALVDASVKCYIDRGFNSLMVSCGCTGGQHRSVYSAQHIAEHIKTKFPQVIVHLVHREQNIDNVL
ncbi:MAG: phosphotransferase [Muribaculum sp.]|nr:phosphotransferase [Muribaculum sp.]